MNDPSVKVLVLGESGTASHTKPFQRHHFALQQSEGSGINVIVEIKSQGKCKHYAIIPNILT